MESPLNRLKNNRHTKTKDDIPGRDCRHNAGSAKRGSGKNGNKEKNEFDEDNYDEICKFNLDWWDYPSVINFTPANAKPILKIALSTNSRWTYLPNSYCYSPVYDDSGSDG